MLPVWQVCTTAEHNGDSLNDPPALDVEMEGLEEDQYPKGMKRYYDLRCHAKNFRTCFSHQEMSAQRKGRLSLLVIRSFLRL